VEWSGENWRRNQATDRAYRIGHDKPVFVHKLICDGTVKDRIHQLQQKKSLLADSLLADSLLAGAVKSTPDAGSLKNLLAPL
jgi:SNF2 family DNA or RNA helicase